MRKKTIHLVLLFSALIATGLTVGCGNIADKNRIRIAKVDEEYITRGDLFELLRNMDDDKRPIIRNRNDFLRVINDHIDKQLKLPLGQQLHEDGKIDVPLDRAREKFFADSGENEEQFRMIYTIEVPESGETTPLMKVYNLTPSTIKGMKGIIEAQAKRVQREMLGDEAVAYLAVEAFKNGEIQISPELLKQEYDFKKDAFQQKERLSFRAIRFPMRLQNALEQAAATRKRIDAGESFEDLVNEFLKANTNPLARPKAERPSVIESDIEHDPNLPRFRSFWETASGANENDIIGPIYLPAHQQIIQNAQGKQMAVTTPDSWLVLKVLKHFPERVMTLEEAKPRLIPPLLLAAQMKRLREEHGVEIYKNKLPDPQEADQQPAAVRSDAAR